MQKRKFKLNIAWKRQKMDLNEKWYFEKILTFYFIRN